VLCLYETSLTFAPSRAAEMALESPASPPPTTSTSDSIAIAGPSVGRDPGV